MMMDERFQIVSSHHYFGFGFHDITHTKNLCVRQNNRMEERRTARAALVAVVLGLSAHSITAQDVRLLVNATLSHHRRATRSTLRARSALLLAPCSVCVCECAYCARARVLACIVARDPSRFVARVSVASKNAVRGAEPDGRARSLPHLRPSVHPPRRCARASSAAATCTGCA